MQGTNTGSLTSLGEIPPTGKKIKVDVIEIDRIINGKIVEEWISYNRLDIIEQLGFKILPPEFPENRK